MTAPKKPTRLSITMFPRDEDVISGHDVALSAWLSQSDGKTHEEAAADLTDELMNAGLHSGIEQASMIYGAVKLLIELAGLPATEEQAA